MSRRPRICPACRRPFPPALTVHGPVRQRTVDPIANRPDGITRAEIISAVYADDVNGGFRIQPTWRGPGARYRLIAIDPRGIARQHQHQKKRSAMNDDREFEEAYAYSKAELAAMTTGELVNVWLLTFPEPTEFGRAWFRQCPAKDRLQMRTRSLKELINASFTIDEAPPPYEGIFAILELDRRARGAGYAHTGQWLRAELDQIKSGTNPNQKENTRD